MAGRGPRESTGFAGRGNPGLRRRRTAPNGNPAGACKISSRHAPYAHAPHLRDRRGQEEALAALPGGTGPGALTARDTHRIEPPGTEAPGAADTTVTAAFRFVARRSASRTHR